MMKVPGCCCFTLETGAKIIGWFVTVVSALSLIILVSTDLVIKSCVVEKQEANSTILGIETIGECKVTEKEYSMYYTVFMIEHLIYFITHVLLLFGVHTRDHCMMLPAIITSFLEIILSFIGLSIIFSWNGVVLAIVANALSLYFALVLYSLYDKIKNEKIFLNFA